MPARLLFRANEMIKKRPKTIVMIGTHFDTMGGISSVVNVYRAAGLFDRWPIRYIATHCDGGRVAKLAIAVKALIQFLALLLLGKVALVHVHVSSGAGFWRKFVFLVPSYLTGVSVVMHLHSGRFHQFYERDCGAFAKRLVRLAFDKAAYVVVLSSGWKAWLETVSENRNIVSIYNPVEVPAQTGGERFERCRVIALGRVCEPKGSHDLLAAAALLKGRHPQIEIILAGDGDVDAFAERVQEIGMQESVTLPGWIRGPEKQRLLDSASVYALPSYAEGLPMGLLEAMANGVPVVSTRVGGIPEAVTDGVEGFLIEPGDVAALTDSLDRLLSDQELAVRMGRAAREKVINCFSTAAIFPQIDAIYSRLGARRA